MTGKQREGLESFYTCTSHKLEDFELSVGGPKAKVILQNVLEAVLFYTAFKIAAVRSGTTDCSIQVIHSPKFLEELKAVEQSKSSSEQLPEAALFNVKALSALNDADLPGASSQEKLERLLQEIKSKFSNFK